MKHLNNFFCGWMAACAVSLFVMYTPGSYRSLAEDALEECEKALPSNQRCVITAVPEIK